MGPEGYRGREAAEDGQRCRSIGLFHTIVCMQEQSGNTMRARQRKLQVIINGRLQPFSLWLVTR